MRKVMSAIAPSRMGASRTTATAFGLLAGLGGITHGIGEVVQGDAPVAGLWIESWTTGPIAAHMGGEPGITVFPTALSAGLATLVTAAGVVTWSTVAMGRKHGGGVLTALSSCMLLAGGGVGPPVIGMLAGAIGRFSHRQPRTIRQMSPRMRRRLAKAWPTLFAVALANGVFLVVGSVVLVYSVGFDAPDLFTNSFYLSVGLLLALLLAAPAYDAERAGGRGVPDRTEPRSTQAMASR